VVEPEALDYVEGPETVWEREPLERLADEGHLAAYRHRGFWQPMDTLRDKNLLEDLWQRGDAPWARRTADPEAGSGEEGADARP
jgi:glucose-1-phosphate cytidylyltransferase